MRIVFLYTTLFLYLELLYTTECCNVEIHATADSTNITSPGYPNQVYPNNLTCWWRVVAADSDHSVIVEVVDSAIDPSTNCTHDSLTFYDGFSSSDPTLGKVCGTQKGTFISTDSAVYIQFKTDSTSHGHKAFLLNVYETAKCGGELAATSNSTTVVSPGYPDHYFNNMSCIWVITAEDENDTVVLNFQPTLIEDSDRCSHDFVEVYNGNDTKSWTLGKFCGNDTKSFQSSNNQLTVFFSTNDAVVKSGFRMSFRSVQADHCNMTLFAGYTPAYFVSPGFPNAVYTDILCVWTIHLLKKGNDHLQLYPRAMDIDHSINCTNASVTVYSGYNKSKELGSFCGTDTPLYSSSSPMTVVFKTNEDARGRGFWISYTVYKPPPTPVPTDCGSNLTAVTAPNYLGTSFPYGMTSCFWRIQTSSPAMMVRIVVMNIDLPFTFYCSGNRIYVSDGPSASSPDLMMWCRSSTTKTTLQSSQQFMYLELTKEANVFGSFRLKYFETNDSYCGGRLYARSTSTTLTSPGYPDYYMSHLDCVWTIYTNYTNIKVDVQDANMEPNDYCFYDYIQIKDGPSESSNSSQENGISCRGKSTFISAGPYVTITFHTRTVGYQLPGFSLEYTGGTYSPCSEQDLDAEYYSNTILSPNYPFSYPRNVDCTWRLDTGASSYTYVSTTVLAFNITYSKDCDSNYVEAFDGYDDSSSSLGRWCGSDMPAKNSSGRYMFIRFHTDNSITNTGFKISYLAICCNTFSTRTIVEIVLGCVGVITAAIGGICGTNKYRSYQKKKTYGKMDTSA